MFFLSFFFSSTKWGTRGQNRFCLKGGGERSAQIAGEVVQIMNASVSNAKRIPIETVPGIGGGAIKESSGGGEFKFDIFHKF
jgi:hypothetical protein